MTNGVQFAIQLYVFLSLQFMLTCVNHKQINDFTTLDRNTAKILVFILEPHQFWQKLANLFLVNKNLLLQFSLCFKILGKLSSSDLNVKQPQYQIYFPDACAPCFQLPFNIRAIIPTMNVPQTCLWKTTFTWTSSPCSPLKFGSVFLTLKNRLFGHPKQKGLQGQEFSGMGASR